MATTAPRMQFTHEAPAGADQSPAGDRRRSPRVDIVSDLSGELVSPAAPIVLREAGTGGFSIESPVGFDIGADYSFRFTNRSGETATVVATCAHSMRVTLAGDLTMFIAGFEFAPQPQRNLQLVLDAIAALG